MPINFRNIGYIVNARPRTPTAGKSAAALRARFERKVLSPEKAGRLYQPCREVLDKLCTAAGINPAELKLFIVLDPQPNALIFPATGEIHITTSLLEKKDLTQGELASSLAHEIGHYLKYSGKKKLPERLRGPLFREFEAGTERAQRQAQEYDADELALIIMDAADYSVDEAITMDRWLAGRNGKGEADSGAGAARILTIGSTHPEPKRRLAAMIAQIDNPKFIFKSRSAEPRRLFPSRTSRKYEKMTEGKATQKIEFELDKDEHIRPAAFFPGDVLSPEFIDHLIQNITFSKFPVVDLFLFLNFGGAGDILSPKLRPRIEKLIPELKERAGDGDAVAFSYLRALIANIYFRAVKEGKTREILGWLEEKCGVKPDEAMVSFLSFLRGARRSGVYRFWRLELLAKWCGWRKSDAPSHLCSTKEKIFFGTSVILGKKWDDDRNKVTISNISADSFVLPFPCSPLRDELIVELFRFPGLIKEWREGVEEVFKNSVIGPGNEKPGWGWFTEKGLRKLLSMLHGLSAIGVEIEDYRNLHEFLFDKPEIDAWEGVPRDLNHMGCELEFYAMVLLLLDGMPCERSHLEFILRDMQSDISDAISWGKIPGLPKEAHIPEHAGIIEDVFSLGRKIRDARVKKTIEEMQRIVLLRILEVLPVEIWDAEILRIIEGLPKSTEKNHLLILLHKAGKRKLKNKELVFEKIPPVGSAGAKKTYLLLDSWGFIAGHEAEEIYPSGQRVLDRFMAEKLPTEGELLLKEVTDVIPRPSPGRDELLDRCRAQTVEEAKAILDAYWSPPAAYAKAHKISVAWLENPEGLNAILEITAEFPSLRRRMVGEWAEKHGIAVSQYNSLLSSREAVDVFDVYKGGLVEKTRGVETLSKLSICLATFAAALSRDGFSLLSVVEDGTIKGIKSRKPGGRATDDFVELGEERDSRNYFPLLPEYASTIAELIWGEAPHEIRSIPFIDDTPAPNFVFGREELAKDAVAEMKKWEGAKNFFNFMRAMGWEEAVTFYEEMFVGEGGIAHNRNDFNKLAEIFLRGVSLLLQDKKVPLARAEMVSAGMRNLLTGLPVEIQARIWARVLAGIAQQGSLGEICREAVRPLKAAGGKLMQAIHSLVVGIDPTLEEATRLALDQTASLSLLEALQFLGMRFADDPFARHQKYVALGSGTVRAAAGGLDGEDQGTAYLLVHTPPADPGVVSAVSNFIQGTLNEGHYFPLTPGQFRGLVEQTEAERLRGFENHASYGELFDWQLGKVRIPGVIRQHSDWAEIELVKGVSYAGLSEEKQREYAPRIVEAALLQLQKTNEKGNHLINPEFHPGNIMVDGDGNIYLIDCGLIGEATGQDVLSLFSLISAFRSVGLPAAAAILFSRSGKSSLNQLSDEKRKYAVGALKVLAGQIEAGVPVELLMPALNGVVARATDGKESPGLNILFRAVQHLTPYLKKMERLPFDLLPHTKSGSLAEEISRELERSDEKGEEVRIPRGVAVGKRLKDGRVISLGVLIEPATKSSADPRLIVCNVGEAKHHVLPGDLLFQVAGEWKPAVK